MSAIPNGAPGSRETWITATFAGGKTIRYLGDPDDPDAMPDFDQPMEPKDEIPDPEADGKRRILSRAGYPNGERE